MTGNNHHNNCACDWCTHYGRAEAVRGALDPPARADGTRVCGAADALALVGDRWSLLVVRELLFGVHRFNDIRRLTGAPRDTLATRLRKLELVGIVERRTYETHPQRFEYHLTLQGAQLAPVLEELRAWGERHATTPPRSDLPA
jgi:DNA-binding HxlR family transcriptional regulator